MKIIPNRTSIFFAGSFPALAFILVFIFVTGCDNWNKEKTAEQPASQAEHDHYQLTINIAERTITHSARDLIKRKDVEIIKIQDIAAYPGKSMTYRAVKFANLLRDWSVDRNSTLVFIAEDGFAAPIRASVLGNTSSGTATAYLAIENPDNKWPAFRTGEGTAGPFYVFWLNPELSNIGREEWPYKFNTIQIKQSFEALYPEIIPEGKASNDPDIMAGYRSYVKNCFACHKLDGAGPSTKGPDLNHPMNPVEYYRDGILQRFIRDPESIRRNPQGVMAGFSEDEIPDTEIGQLLTYLKYMAGRNR